jgi:ABC-2 type transport system ATP-binding protein
MDKGKIIAYGTHDELIKLVGGQTRIDLTLNTEGEKVLAAWKTVEGVSGIDSTAGASTGLSTGLVTVLVDDSNLVLPHLFEASAKLGARITSVDIQEPNLETVFLHLTGRALRD